MSSEKKIGSGSTLSSLSSTEKAALGSTYSSITKSPFLISLMAGGAAGTCVDTALFPLDTLKTRLQAAEGFRKAGGFRGVYKGLSSAVAGSAPGAALFFGTYESTKVTLEAVFGDGEKSKRSRASPYIHMTAASLGEVMACLVRVPTEIVKQRLQTGQYKSFGTAIRSISSTEGIAGFYRGFFSTILREIPFSLIQFPLWEYSKTVWSDVLKGGRPTDPWEGAICGSVCGGFAAAVTTPLDVAKTRIMLGRDANGKATGAYSNGTVATIRRLYAEEGMSVLFSGVYPRTFWISIGGLVFFGSYEKFKSMFEERK
eukprot:Nk52_evm49s2579 gene=Nk52_evmTU49s2579